MENSLRNATVKASGKKVQVYVHRITGNFVDYADCKTIYTKEQLTFY